MVVSRDNYSEETAKTLYKGLREATTAFVGGQMLPHLIESLNVEHPTTQQLILALLFNLLTGVKTEWADARNMASNTLVKSFQEWLEAEIKSGKIHVDRNGYLTFPLI